MPQRAPPSRSSSVTLPKAAVRVLLTPLLLLPLLVLLVLLLLVLVVLVVLLRRLAHAVRVMQAVTARVESAPRSSFEKAKASPKPELRRRLLLLLLLLLLRLLHMKQQKEELQAQSLHLHLLRLERRPTQKTFQSTSKSEECPHLPGSCSLAFALW